MDLGLIARQTLQAFERGYYTGADGERVDLSAPLAACLVDTRGYTPDELARLRNELQEPGDGGYQSTFALLPETTLSGAAALARSGAYQRVGVLNFASARRPGGGFLNGATAQEESLARSSALYLSLITYPAYYDHHRALHTSMYSDHMIYSPVCPVIRDDEGGWEPAPFLVDFITSAAPNARAVTNNEPDNLERIPATLKERAGKILALAAHRGCDALVLGAWGCGVFQNMPTTVASVFHGYLRPDGLFGHQFRHIRFSVYDSSFGRTVYEAFARRFADVL